MENGHVIVTGAAGGIGQQTVTELVQREYAVSALDVKVDSLQKLPVSNDGSIVPIVADATDSRSVEEAVNKAVETLGTPYGLVNLAGDNILKPLTDLSNDDWDYLINVNLSSVFYLCRKVMPLMSAAGGGRVVNMSSIFGLRGETNDAGYAAAKAGVVGITRALALEYAPHGVTANCIAPVVTMTERVAQMPGAHLAKQKARIPMARFGEPKDITRTVAFLLGDGGDFYTGQTFSPNGGDLMQ